MNSEGRWLTAIPMIYQEDRGFWNRDMGLLCLGLREAGVPCHFVALGESGMAQDKPLILCRPEQMQDAAWWRQWQASDVVLNSWAMRKYDPVARSIKAAGARLIVNVDTDGLLSPHVWFWRHLQQGFFMSKDAGRSFPAMRAVLKTFLFYFFPALFDRRVQHHLSMAEMVTVATPLARERCRRLMISMGRPDLAGRIRSLPLPVRAYFDYNPAVLKQSRIIAVGRWEASQKDTPMLARVLGHALTVEPDYSALVVGSGEDRMRRLVAGLPPAVQSRIQIRGPVPHEQLGRLYQESRMLFLSSRYESFHIAAAEALCCGCSVVGPAHIPSMPYFITACSGTVAAAHTCRHFSDALCAEMDAWRLGERDPVRISQFWRARFTPRAVGSRLLQLGA
jgi:glycosyltransferase involved in cell wall biosynthesis